VQATKTFAKVKLLIQAALAKVEGAIKGAVKIIARLTYRQRYAQSIGRDPFRCPHCQGEMAVWRIWHPTYGVIHIPSDLVVDSCHHMLSAAQPLISRGYPTHGRKTSHKYPTKSFLTEC
jgi:hypothetical protein